MAMPVAADTGPSASPAIQDITLNLIFAVMGYGHRCTATATKKANLSNQPIVAAAPQVQR
jgi:hypothetical protein